MLGNKCAHYSIHYKFRLSQHLGNKNHEVQSEGNFFAREMKILKGSLCAYILEVDVAPYASYSFRNLQIVKQIEMLILDQLSVPFSIMQFRRNHSAFF